MSGWLFVIDHVKNDPTIYNRAETSLSFKTITQRGQHYWSTIGRHVLSRTVFLHHILKIKPNLDRLKVLDGRLIELATMEKLSLER